MEKSKLKYYIYIALAIILTIGAVATAFFQGRKDGAKHRLNQVNQASNQAQ
ncbi:MAG: hypothetical protein M3388_10520 [Acidobacteriota bacterium]|nr:hypothetical protein [Acidobacteriota bacterium]